MTAGFIRVKYFVTYESDVDLSAYSGMTPDEAVAYELSNEVETILELITTGATESNIEIMRSAKYVTE
jgi:hypothetical protein